MPTSSADSEATPPPRARPALMLRRAAIVRCPQCGGGDLKEHALRLRPRCPGCRLRLDRGEGDHFIGAYLLNLVLALSIAAVFMLGAVAVTWPDVPWRLLAWAGLGLMVAAPLLLYPISKMLWLATDLIFRAPSRADFDYDVPEPPKKPGDLDSATPPPE